MQRRRLAVNRTAALLRIDEDVDEDAGATAEAEAEPAPEAEPAVEASGPAWTRGELEAPAGEKDLGTSVQAVYTAEQQAGLGVDEHGAKV